MHPNNILATAIRELVKTHGDFASGDEEEEIMDHHINQLGKDENTIRLWNTHWRDSRKSPRCRVCSIYGCKVNEQVGGNAPK